MPVVVLDAERFTDTRSAPLAPLDQGAAVAELDLPAFEVGAGVDVLDNQAARLDP